MSIFKETFQDFVFNQLTIREAILTQNSNRLLGAPIVSGLKKEENEYKENLSKCSHLTEILESLVLVNNIKTLINNILIYLLSSD